MLLHVFHPIRPALLAYVQLFVKRPWLGINALQLFYTTSDE